MSETEVTTLKLLEGYKFKAEFGVEGIPSLVIDELVPIGEGAGPSPILLLSVAVGHCLSSSLLYCLKRARIEVNDLQTKIVATKAKNQEGRVRVANIDVKIQLGVNEEDKDRVHRCIDIYENYCTVTQSVMQGIKVNIDIAKT